MTTGRSLSADDRTILSKLLPLMWAALINIQGPNNLEDPQLPQEKTLQRLTHYCHHQANKVVKEKPTAAKAPKESSHNAHEAEDPINTAKPSNSPRTQSASTRTSLVSTPPSSTAQASPSLSSEANSTNELPELPPLPPTTSDITTASDKPSINVNAHDSDKRSTKENDLLLEEREHIKRIFEAAKMLRPCLVECIMNMPFEKSKIHHKPLLEFLEKCAVFVSPCGNEVIFSDLYGDDMMRTILSATLDHDIDEYSKNYALSVLSAMHACKQHAGSTSPYEFEFKIENLGNALVLPEDPDSQELSFTPFTISFRGGTDEATYRKYYEEGYRRIESDGVASFKFGKIDEKFLSMTRNESH